MTHFIQLQKEKFDSVVKGLNYQILKPKMYIKPGDRIIFECADDATQQKESVVIDVLTEPGLLKGYYFIQHEMK